MKALLVILALAGPARAGEGWKSSLPEALATAKASGKKVLVDFTAPWCYSCYYMEKNVLNRPAFADLVKDLALARIDVDQPEGLALKNAHHVRFLPSFLLLDAQGKELGRILGEQREDEFLALLKAMLGPAKRTPEDEAVSALESYLKREELDKAAALVAKPAPATTQILAQRADWRKLALRLELKRKPTAEGLKAMAELNDACDFAYDLDAGLKAKPSREALAALRPRLEAWHERRYWVKRPDRCADFRSGVQAMADFYAQLGDDAAKSATLERAMALVSYESDSQGLGTDRNSDDDRRYFLEAAGRDAELDSLYPRLVDAYPADYVYAYRYAKWLAGKSRYADALPWIEKAARLCYGANRLSVTRTQADILAHLGRKPEAETLLRREIKGYKKRLPKEVKPLEELLATLAR